MRNFPLHRFTPISNMALQALTQSVSSDLGVCVRVGRPRCAAVPATTVRKCRTGRRNGGRRQCPGAALLVERTAEKNNGEWYRTPGDAHFAMSGKLEPSDTSLVRCSRAALAACTAPGNSPVSSGSRHVHDALRAAGSALTTFMAFGKPLVSSATLPWRWYLAPLLPARPPGAGGRWLAV